MRIEIKREMIEMEREESNGDRERGREIERVKERRVMERDRDKKEI